MHNVTVLLLFETAICIARLESFVI